MLESPKVPWEKNEVQECTEKRRLDLAKLWDGEFQKLGFEGLSPRKSNRIMVKHPSVQNL